MQQNLEDTPNYGYAQVSLHTHYLRSRTSNK
jgi:hypothetical protein